MLAPEGAGDASSATDDLAPTLISSSELATTRQQSSPTPALPVDTHIQLSSSQPLSPSTSASGKATARFSDAVANLSGRNRTSSSISNARGTPYLKGNEAEEVMEGSSFGIDPDPFASDFNGTSSVAPSTSEGSHVHSDRGGKKQRTSLFVTASDVLGFSRGFTIGRRISKRNPDDQTSENPQRRGPGLPWKSKPKGKGHWALQPPSSLQVHDVIEISAANGSRTTTRRAQEDVEEKERERLREAAAESIGLSPLVREDASSRLNGNDSVRFGEESFEDIGTESIGEVIPSPFNKMNSLDSLRANGTGTIKPSAVPNGLLAEARQTRHSRSNSLSGALTPTTPTSFSSGLPGAVAGFPPRSSTPTSSKASTILSSPLPPFPCVYSSLEPFMKKSSTLLKHFPSSSLILLGLSRQWRSRCLVLTSPRTPSKPSLLNGFRPDRSPSVFHLHLFKSSAADERELERVQINEDSVVYLADEEIGGKTSVVKVGGVDVGGRKKELNLEENGQTMWILHASDLTEGQSWISTLKSAVLDQRAEKAGFGMSSQPSLVVGPKGDLDVLLSIRAQDVGASVINGHYSNLPARPQSSITVRDLMNRSFPSNISPSPTVRSWTGDGRRMSSLKGLFSVPGRARASSQITTRSEASTRTRDENGSFASRGQTLMSMLRSSTPSNGTGSERKEDTPSSNGTTPVMPGPILSAEAVLSMDSSPSEKPITTHRELPAWYSIQHRRGDSSSSLNVGHQSLLPPPRARTSRPRTSPGSVSKGRGSFETYPGRKVTVHDSLTPDGRLSLDEPARSHSPVDSIGTNPGVFGTPDFRSRHTSLSSTVSSMVSTPADRDPTREGSRRSNSIQRRMRMNKQIPKMLAPPSGPPPSIPTSHSQPSIVMEATSPETPRSRASSLRSKDFHSLHNGVTQNPRRMSTSVVSMVSTTSQRRLSDLQGNRKSGLSSLPTKRVSMPPPPRPAPTFALPPTPQQLDTGKPSTMSARKASFRQSFSPRSLRFSLSPPPNKALPPRPDEPTANGRASAHRRSLSSELTRSSSMSHAFSSSPPRAPPPLGPLPPTPQEAPTVTRPSIRERLRMRSTPSTPPPDLIRVSTPPTALPHAAPLVPISSVSSLKKERHRLAIGEPITTISSDLNFLNMSVHELSNSLPPDADFLNMSSPVSATAPMSIPSRGDGSGSPFSDAPQASPPSLGVTVLPPPPRRTKIPTPIDDSDDINEPMTPTTSDLNVDVDVVDVHVRKHFDASISRDTLAAVH